MTIIAGILVYAFSSEDVSHAIVLVGIVITVIFLVIEAQRFRRYDVWRTRVRSMQENLFANALDPSAGVEERDWRRQLSEDYRSPEVRMSLWEALAHRLRRVSLPLLTGLLLVWLIRLNGADGTIVEAATVSNTPGWIVFGSVVVGYLILLVLALWPGTAAPTETGDDEDLGDLGTAE